MTVKSGISPIRKVAAPISNNDNRNDRFLPTRSPMEPKIREPIGLIKKEDPTMASVSRKAVESLSGKKFLLRTFARIIARNKSYHSSSVPVADAVMITRILFLRSFMTRESYQTGIKIYESEVIKISNETIFYPKSARDDSAYTRGKTLVGYMLVQTSQPPANIGE